MKDYQRKPPWTMTRAEWDRERNSTKTRPNFSTYGGTKNSGAEAQKRMENLEFLLDGANDRWHRIIDDAFTAAKAGLPSHHPPLRRRKARKHLNSPIRHYDVVRNALLRGDPVPPEIIAEYPKLQAAWRRLQGMTK